jgi:hypothetical protein
MDCQIRQPSRVEEAEFAGRRFRGAGDRTGSLSRPGCGAVPLFFPRNPSQRFSAAPDFAMVGVGAACCARPSWSAANEAFR